MNHLVLHDSFIMLGFLVSWNVLLRPLYFFAGTGICEEFVLSMP